MNSVKKTYRRMSIDALLLLMVATSVTSSTLDPNGVEPISQKRDEIKKMEVAPTNCADEVLGRWYESWQEKCKHLMKLGIVMVEDRPSPYADQIKKDVAKTLTALCDDRIKVIKSTKVVAGLNRAANMIKEWKKKDKGKQFEPAQYRVLLVDHSKDEKLRGAETTRQTIEAEGAELFVIGVGEHKNFEDVFAIASTPKSDEPDQTPRHFSIRRDYSQMPSILQDVLFRICPSPTQHPPFANSFSRNASSTESSTSNSDSTSSGSGSSATA